MQSPDSLTTMSASTNLPDRPTNNPTDLSGTSNAHLTGLNQPVEIRFVLQAIATDPVKVIATNRKPT